MYKYLFLFLFACDDTQIMAANTFTKQMFEPPRTDWYSIFPAPDMPVGTLCWQYRTLSNAPVVCYFPQPPNP